MENQDELFQLIQSLTASEKRYFKVHGEKGSHYMKLFDAIDAQKEHYDEALLKQKYKKEKFVKYLSAEKKQLREHIMKHMRDYHSGGSIDVTINQLLEDSRFYGGKGLNELNHKALLKAKEIASKFERFHILSEILARLVGFVVEFEKKKITEPVVQLINEQKHLAILQETELELQTKNRELFSLYRSGADIQDPAIESRASMLIAEIEHYRIRTVGSFRLGVQFHRGYGNFAQLHTDWKTSLEHTKSEYDLYQKYSHFKNEDSYHHKICLANLMARAMSAKDDKWFLKATEEMKSLPANTFNEEGEVFQNVYFFEHFFYINQGDFEKAEALVPVIEEGLIMYEAKINQARKLAFQFNIMIMYFTMHEFKTALKWCNTLLEDKSEIKQHMKFVSSLLLPIIHFELGHADLVDSLTRSAYRLLQGNKRLHAFERLVVKYLKDMPLSSDKKEFYTKLEDFDKNLQAIFDDADESVAYGMEEMKLWAGSHLTGRKMSDLILEL